MKTIKRITMLCLSLLITGVVSAQFLQTDWSGGGGQAVFNDPTMFNSSFHVDYSSAPGDLIAENGNKTHMYGVVEYNGKLLITTGWTGTYIYDPVNAEWEFSHIGIAIYKNNTTIHTDGKLYALYGYNIFRYDGTHNDYGMGPNGWEFHSNIKSYLSQAGSSYWTIHSAQNRLMIGCRVGYNARVIEWSESTQSWTQMGNAFTNGVCSIVEYNGIIYAGTHWAGTVYKWTGSSWVYAFDTRSMSIVDLEVHDGYLYAAGTWDWRWGELYRYNGSNCETIQYFSGFGVFDLQSHNDILAFSLRPKYTTSSMGVQQWDGSTVSPLYTFNGECYSYRLCSYQGDLYYGGVLGTSTSVVYKNGQNLETIYVKGVYSSEFPTANGALNVDATNPNGSGTKVFVQGKNNPTYNASPWVEIPDGTAVPITEDVMRYWAIQYTVGEGGGPTLHEISIGNQVTDPLLISVVSQSDVSCFGSNDGAVEVLAIGGTPPYVYNLNGANTTSSITLYAGTYLISVTDALGGESNVEVVISEPEQLVSTIEWTNISCNGGNDGTIDLTVSGGSQPYTYLWSNGSTDEDLSGLIAGLYDVTITDANGCTIETSASLSEPDQLVAFIEWANISCNSGNDGAIDLTVTGGSQPYTYLWSNGSTDEDLSGLTAGLYDVTITDANGCTVETSASLSEPDLLTVTITSPFYSSGYNISCFGMNDGEILSTVGGGTPPYNYAWSNGTNNQNCISLEAGAYNLTITDINNCIAYAEIILLEPDQVNAYAGEDALVYYGYDPMASTQLAASGGVSYSWSPVDGLDDPTIANPIANPIETTIYTVTVTDQFGCSNTDDVIVEVIDVRCGKKMNKVLICHNDHTICVSENAVQAHLNHGDYLGECMSETILSMYEHKVEGELDVHAFPNPFQRECQIEVTTQHTTSINIYVYDVQGRLHSTIFEGILEAGKYTYHWDYKSALNNGIYFIKVISNSEVKTIKLIKN